jgi:aryl-alcohol dehydrogenase-like predicted oxidoreductase
LGGSGVDVSVLALGSWWTYERIGGDEGIAVMRTARERGVTFLDDARYDDETGNAPIRTGYSEVIFGELFRAAGWRRDEAVVANKLWWEFWPEQSAAEVLDASLERMGFDYLDLAYSWATVNGPRVEEVVSAVGGLISSGRVRAWAVLAALYHSLSVGPRVLNDQHRRFADPVALSSTRPRNFPASASRRSPYSLQAWPRPKRAPWSARLRH